MIPQNAPSPAKNNCDDDRKAEIARDTARIGVALSASETVSRFGSANAEYIKGYAGMDNETGQRLHDGLKSLSVASRTIIWSLVKQVRVCVMPLFHGLHRRTALER